MTTATASFFFVPGWEAEEEEDEEEEEEEGRNKEQWLWS